MHIFKNIIIWFYETWLFLICVGSGVVFIIIFFRIGKSFCSLEFWTREASRSSMSSSQRVTSPLIADKDPYPHQYSKVKRQVQREASNHNCLLTVFFNQKTRFLESFHHCECASLLPCPWQPLAHIEDWDAFGDVSSIQCMVYTSQHSTKQALSIIFLTVRIMPLSRGYRRDVVFGEKNLSVTFFSLISGGCDGALSENNKTFHFCLPIYLSKSPNHSANNCLAIQDFFLRCHWTGS